MTIAKIIEITQQYLSGEMQPHEYHKIRDSRWYEAKIFKAVYAELSIIAKDLN